MVWTSRKSGKERGEWVSFKVSFGQQRDAFVCLGREFNELYGGYVVRRYALWRLSRITRDNIDVDKFVSSILSQNRSDSVIMWCNWMSARVIDGGKINCYIVKENVIASTKRFICGDFRLVKFKRSNRATPMKSFTCAAKIQNEEASVDPETIFCRISFHWGNLRKNLESSLNLNWLNIRLHCLITIGWRKHGIQYIRFVHFSWW